MRQNPLSPRLAAPMPSGFALAGPQGQEGKAWAGEEAALSGWVVQSLASVALACGHSNLARRMGKEGFSQATMLQALREAPASRKELVQNIASRVESEAIKDASEEALASKKPLRI